MHTAHQHFPPMHPPHPGRRRLVRSALAGAVACILMFAAIKAFRPALFEDRNDRIVEQCVKTGVAVFAFTQLVSLSRIYRAKH